MKKVAAIATALLGVIAIGAYVLLANRPAGGPADPEGANEDAPALTGKMSPAASPDATGGDADVSPEWLDLSKPRWHSSTSGAVTEFDLFEGEIGYVDVNSVVQDRNPYSVVALLKKHRALTGAGESLELEIESTGKTPKGYSADFAQVIGGTRTEGRGVVAFDTSGAVYVAYGDLLDTNVADAGAIKILQAEAEAIALEAARRYSETRRSTSVARGESLRTVIYAAELRYALDPDAGNALRAEWRLAIGTFSPYDSLEVLVSAETGEVVSVESVVMEYTVTQARCEGVKFRVCDAGLVATQVSCSSGSANPVDPIFDGQDCVAEPESKCEKRLYKTPKDNAYKAIEYVKQRGTEYLEGVGGDDCTIDILVGDRQFVGDEDAAHYDPNADAIVIKSGNEHNETVMVHEVFHAVSKGRGDIEHGLVYSMDAIYKEGADSEWNYRDASLTRDQVIYRGDTALVVGNAMYRIFKRMGVRQKDEVFRFALEVEREQPTSLGAFRRALVRVAKAKFSEAFQQAVAAVLVEMGINDAPAGTIPESMLQFIVAKMRALALKSNGDEAAWAGRAAAEAMREIRRRLGLDDDQVLRSRPRRGG